MALGDWIHYRLEVHGDVARLFLDNADHPALIVNDLKLGERSGAVGLWIGPGTEAHFTNITIEKRGIVNLNQLAVRLIDMNLKILVVGWIPLLGLFPL